MKSYIIITLFTLIFSYIDQPCNAGTYGMGVCVKKSSCTLYGRQQGRAISYAGRAPNWPCPNDPSNVICCVKVVTRLKNGVANKEGRCLNVNQCKGTTINTGECPGSNKVKLCITNTQTTVNSVYRVNTASLNIRKGDDVRYGIVVTLSNGQYIFVSTISSNGWAKFYKGYVNSKYLTKVSSIANYKVNTGGLNFRLGPGTSYSKYSYLSKGAKFIYYSRDPWNTNWAVTNYGYCSASYITKINNSPSPALLRNLNQPLLLNLPIIHLMLVRFLQNLMVLNYPEIPLLIKFQAIVKVIAVKLLLLYVIMLALYMILLNQAMLMLY